MVKYDYTMDRKLVENVQRLRKKIKINSIC